MHERAKVVLAHHVDHAKRMLLEVVPAVLTVDVLPLDGDMLISVWPTLFMPESYSMHQLVQDSMQSAKIFHEKYPVCKK